jgi:hypothetical protein
MIVIADAELILLSEVGEGADVGVHGLTFVARSTAGYFGDAKVSRLLFVLVDT